MPVEASDIVQTVMGSGDSSYTGCEEADLGSDDGVRKMTDRTREASLSNQIHMTKRDCERKPWKSRLQHHLSLQTPPDKRSSFSAVAEILFWKSQNTQVPLRFTFLMRGNAWLCQTG
jgi:hypothetical protein